MTKKYNMLNIREMRSGCAGNGKENVRWRKGREKKVCVKG